MLNTISRKIIARTGNEIMAEAMRQINPDVVAAYPITPATEIVQIFSSFVSNGQVDTEFIAVESEHSAMSACIGASSAGARVMTSTSSQGLALMYEMLYIAAGLRLPIILAEVNRTLSAPLNIHCDHSDTMGARDSGWIQIFSENAQEAYEQLIQSVKIAENALLPIMVTTDGFIISHGMERVEILEDKEVKDFIGEYKPIHSLLNIDKPFTSGPVAFTNSYFEHKRSQVEAIKQSKTIIKQVQKQFNEQFGTNYDIFEKYCLDDAEIAIVVLGSTAGTTKVVIDELRKKGIKAGMLKIRVFRPFYYEEIKDTLSSLKAIAVLDRSDSGNAFVGPLCAEIKASLYESDKKPLIINYIYGLGGRDVTIAQIKSVFENLE
ncbi:MAG: pyruvate ferredoxin oxidoreductase, partial [bacterium]